MSNFDRNTHAPTYGAGVARADAVVYDQGLRSYMLGIYNHMAIALAISGLVAIGIFMLATTTDPSLAAVKLRNGTMLTALGKTLYLSPLKWVVMLAPLAFVFVLAWRWDRMSIGSLTGTFWAYAAIMGVSLATVFLVYTQTSVGKVFFITAAAFAGLSLWGYTTKKSLSGMGSFMIMGLFGLIIASLVNLFVQSSAMQFAISVIGVLIFAGLTAWDTQRLKEDYNVLASDQTLMAKSSVMGALSLYLNFVNMFQFMLALFGNRE